MAIKSMSDDSLRKLTGFVDNMNEEVTKIVLESEKDFRKYPDLLNLVNDFFNTNTHLSDLCASLKTCLEKTQQGELIIGEALAHYMEEEKSVASSSGLELNFTKTLEDLTSFKKYSGELSFSGDFTKRFRSCHRDMVQMILGLKKTVNKIDKKLRRIRFRRRVSVTLFLGLLAVVLGGAIVVGLLTAPPVVAAVGAAVSCLPIGSFGVIVSTWWQKSKSVLKRQKRAMNSMERGSCVALSKVEKMSFLVNRLGSVMKLMDETVGDATEKKSPVRETMSEVEKEFEIFKTTFTDLQQETGRCNENLILIINVARDNILNYLTQDKEQHMSFFTSIFSEMVN